MPHHLGLSGLPGFDLHPFRHIQENARRHPDVPLPVGDIGHDAAAVLVDRGFPVFAVEEERLTRFKHTMGLPSLAAEACAQACGLPLAELPAAHYLDLSGDHLDRHLQATAGGDPQTVQAIRAEFERARSAVSLVHRAFPRLESVDHHLAHAASAYYLSGFDRSLVLVMDGNGESESLNLYLGEGPDLKPLLSLPATSSLGLLYAFGTHFLGFEPIEDEYKVMGLAAYGDDAEHRAFFDGQVEWGEEGGFTLPALLKDPAVRTLRWSRQLGAPRQADEPIRDRHIAVAASLQGLLERTVQRLLEPFEARHRTRHLCLAGGVALNCSLNGVLDRQGPFDRLFVQPAAGDPGAALGAALVAERRRGFASQAGRMPSPYLGPGYTAREVEAALAAHARELRWERPAELPERVVDLLEGGAIVGWFQGRMEFGPRALGNRSILADPRRPEMKDRVNRAVKKREEFRPFAPSVTAEAADAFFHLRDLAQYEHMTVAVRARAERAAEIPAVVHANGSSRVQVVRREANPRYWDLLTRMGRRTGVPMVLNTSFNVRGEPIVCSPTDAIRCFLGTGLDALVLEDVLVFKTGPEA
ncbi:MAG: carbamoyltransferase C-terminal domain-containing protein [Holophagaceae bacterium]